MSTQAVQRIEAVPARGRVEVDLRRALNSTGVRIPRRQVDELIASCDLLSAYESVRREVALFRAVCDRFKLRTRADEQPRRECDKRLPSPHEHRPRAASDRCSIRDMGRRVRRRGPTAAELTAATLSSIDTLDGTIKAFITTVPDRAVRAAAAMDEELARGIDRGPLHGIPYALKDNVDTAGIRTTCNSRLHAARVPAKDSFVADRLSAAGAVLVGKLAMDELACGGRALDVPAPPARNPWNVEHVTGGSSSGCAAAVAAGLVPLAIGSDTAGSIRVPAAFCGVVGVKPTFGLISRRGLFPLSATHDHCGLVARSVEDAAVSLTCLRGHDPDDPASVAAPPSDYLDGLDEGANGLRVGALWSFFDGVGDEADAVRTAFGDVIGNLARQGATVVPVPPDHVPDYAAYRACGAIVLITDAFAVHADDVRTKPEAYGRMTLRRLILGAATLADRACAFECRQLLRAAIEHLFDEFDVLISPTVVSAAPRADGPPVPLTKSPARTVPFNMSGHPAITVPVGLDRDGLPLAVQVAGRAFDECTMFRVAAAVEAASGLDAGMVTACSAVDRRYWQAPK